LVLIDALLDRETADAPAVRSQKLIAIQRWRDDSHGCPVPGRKQSEESFGCRWEGINDLTHHYFDRCQLVRRGFVDFLRALDRQDGAMRMGALKRAGDRVTQSAKVRVNLE
jgi:hypothetical protein